MNCQKAVSVFLAGFAVLFGIQAHSAEAAESGPRIKLEKVAYDFGEVAPRSRHECEFAFENVGDEVLKIEDITGTCGCTPFELEKREYAPGEGGALRVRYNSARTERQERHRIYLTTNDPANERVMLTVLGKVVQTVAHEPKRLNLVLSEENAGAGPITISSGDDQPFSIKRITSTGNSITADIDSSEKAESFVIEPKVNMERLRRASSGTIRITIDHPEASEISIPFETLARFEINPPSVNLMNAEKGKAVEREIWVLNNYEEPFEVEEVSSQNNKLELISKEQVGNRYKLIVRITPPEDAEGVMFSDIMTIKIADDDDPMDVRIRGFFARN